MKNVKNICKYQKFFVTLQTIWKEPAEVGTINILKVMIITTTPTIEGHTIKEYKGLVSGEVIFGMNFLKDFGASLRDFFGGRTDSYEKAMLEGRETAQQEMRERAEKLGANAIVGVSYGYETMGQANGMIMISVSGTAVKID